MPQRPAWIKAIYNSPAWKATRLATLIRDNWTCRRCHGYGNTAHHIVALEDGGAPFDLCNTTTLCRSCHAHVDNMRRPDEPFPQYARKPHRRKVNRFLSTVLRHGGA